MTPKSFRTTLWIQTSGANKKVLREIDFSHQKEALVFG